VNPPAAPPTAFGRRRLSRRAGAAAALLALVFLAFHLPFLPASLEDLDSINFALGVRHFDVAQHQPHPPGYPLFVLAAKGAHAIIVPEAKALSVIGVIAGALASFALVTLYRRLDERADASIRPIAAAIVAVSSPLYWFTAARPLSDTAGLAAALAVQALALAAPTPGALAVAASIAGLAIGVRSQAAWLTVPLIAFLILRRRDDARARTAARAGAAFGAGVLAWGVPLVILTGGPAAYWHAISSQGTEDLSGVTMLWTQPTLRELAAAVYYACVAPWAAWPMASALIVLAAIGAVHMCRNARPALATLAVAFVPYLVFDLLFQETVTTRYALPLVVPVAYLAVQGASIFGTPIAVALIVPLAMYDAHVGGTSVAAYAGQPAPAFRMLEDMHRTAGPGGPPVMAMDRREALDLRRPIQWIGERMPHVAARLPSPPNHEWLEVVKYWNGDSRRLERPLWYVADPLRTDIDFVQHGDPAEYRWPLPYPVLIGGARPNEMSWYRIRRPEWYVGEGWALTPELAGVAAADGRNPAAAPITAWVARDAIESAAGGALVIGGRNLDAGGPPARVTARLEGIAGDLIDVSVPPGPFLRVLPFGRILPAGSVTAGYASLSVRASAGSHVAIEQFDASSDRPVFGFGEGWHESEYNPRLGRRWRWVSERGTLRVHAAHDVVLHLEGESPLTYFSRPSRLVIRAGDRILRDDRIAADFSIDTVIPVAALRDPVSEITIETDQIYVPGDRSRRTRDRRHLGLRIFSCTMRRG
jgi:hypothetical protein